MSSVVPIANAVPTLAVTERPRPRSLRRRSRGRFPTHDGIRCPRTSAVPCGERRSGTSADGDGTFRSLFSPHRPPIPGAADAKQRLPAQRGAGAQARRRNDNRQRKHRARCSSALRENTTHSPPLRYSMTIRACSSETPVFGIRIPVVNSSVALRNCARFRLCRHVRAQRTRRKNRSRRPRRQGEAQHCAAGARAVALPAMEYEQRRAAGVALSPDALASASTDARGPGMAGHSSFVASHRSPALAGTSDVVVLRSRAPTSPGWPPKSLGSRAMVGSTASDASERSFPPPDAKSEQRRWEIVSRHGRLHPTEHRW